MLQKNRFMKIFTGTIPRSYNLSGLGIIPTNRYVVKIHIFLIFSKKSRQLIRTLKPIGNPYSKGCIF